MADLLAQTGSTLTNTPGIATVTAARLIGRTGRASFPNASACANYAGTAPIEIASANRTRHRLSRRGDRQLNSALHPVATTQIRMPSSPGHTYYTRKIAEGKTPHEARHPARRARTAYYAHHRAQHPAELTHQSLRTRSEDGGGAASGV